MDIYAVAIMAYTNTLLQEFQVPCGGRHCDSAATDTRRILEPQRPQIQFYIVAMLFAPAACLHATRNTMSSDKGFVY